MQDEIIVHLPFPPTVNSYYGTSRSGVKFITKRGRQFREDVEKQLVQQIGRLELDENMHVEVVLHPPDKRKRDLDNYMKALLDACTVGGLWSDDSLIDQLTVLRGETVKCGKTQLEINPAGPVIKVNCAPGQQ